MTVLRSSEPAHPAKFSTEIITLLALHIGDEGARLGRPPVVLDPFAGVGRIHQLADAVECVTFGVEIESEWADTHPRTFVGDARDVAVLFDLTPVDVIATSPCYGNRMADTYDGRGTCRLCAGTGMVADLPGRPESGPAECDRCGGSGRDRSRRHTYTVALGRPLTAGNAGAMQWGDDYRALHEAAASEWPRVLRPGGLVLVNMSNHVRGGEEQYVTEWWIGMLAAVGFGLVGVEAVRTSRLRHGQNHAVRVDGERLIIARAPS